MKLTLESIREAIRSYYDRLIAFLAILILLGSLVVLLMRIGTIKADENRFQSWKQNLTPAFENATNVTLDLFVQGHNSLTNPFQIGAWTRNLSIPELRVACVACSGPMPYDATVCIHCGYTPPDRKEEKDKDQDMMDDTWETARGLNPLDPDDASTDLDKDGFTNLEEYRNSTDPADPAVHPPIVAKLDVTDISAMPFHLKFMAVNKLTSGNLFQVNSSKSGKTAWFKLGDEVDGYTIKEYQPIRVQVPQGKGGMTFEEDHSTLTLESKTSGRVISLRKGEAVPINEYVVKMVLALDNTELTVRHGADFNLRGTVYTVKEIDNKNSKVLIVDKDSGKETWIGRQAETVAPPPINEAGN